MSYNHALQQIERYGGSVSENDVTIKCQQPVPVRYEKAFEGMYPAEKVHVNKNLPDVGELSFDEWVSSSKAMCVPLMLTMSHKSKCISTDSWLRLPTSPLHIQPVETTSSGATNCPTVSTQPPSNGSTPAPTPQSTLPICSSTPPPPNPHPINKLQSAPLPAVRSV